MVEISEKSYNIIRNSNRIYFHSGCPDGITARNILSGIFPKYISDLEFYYPASPSNKLPLIANAIFIDMAPIGSQFEDFLKIGSIILDHHESNRYLFDKYKDSYPDQLIFGENEDHESGAMLAYKVVEAYHKYHFKYESAYGHYDEVSIKELAELISISDCWHKDNPCFEDGRAMANFILLQGNSFDHNSYDEDILKIAKSIYENKKKDNQRIAKKAEKIIVDYNGQEIKVCMLNQENISDVSEVLRSEYGVNLVIGWQKDTYINKQDPDKINKIIKFSLRSDDRINVRELAQIYGGGGHDRAAGFSVPDNSLAPREVLRNFDFMNILKDNLADVGKWNV